MLDGLIALKQSLMMGADARSGDTGSSFDDRSAHVESRDAARDSM
ncbi:hypothetical protein [Burkholderia gladioli]|nr:hypothetical protein [Burkholderia gladioli]